MKTKVNLKILQILLVFFAYINIVNAQYPIEINVAVAPPYPSYFSDFLEQSGTTVLVIRNTDLNNGYKIKFGGTIEGDNGVRIELNSNYTPAYPLLISAGEVVVLSGDDLRALYPNISIDDFIYKGPKISQVIQSQRVPEGNYTGCIQAYDYFEGTRLSEDPPFGCTGNIPYYSLDPPIITTPYNKQTIFSQVVQQLVVTWTNVAGAQTPILYNFRMVHVPKGVNSYDAMESDNLLVWEEMDILAPVFIYGPDKPPLAINQLYAIRVQAYDENNITLISDDGYSEIVLFYYKEGAFVPVDVTPQDTTTTVNPPDDPIENEEELLVGGNFECGGACTDVDINNTSDVIPPVLEGSQVFMGHFILNLDQFSRNGNFYSGTGRIEAPDFIDIPIRVSFNNLRINSDRQVFSGSAKALQNADLIAVNWLNTDDEPLATNDATLGDIYDLLLDPSGSISSFIDDLPQVDINVGISLPIGYGTTDYDMHIVGMNFTPNNATVNVMSGLAISGDYEDGEKHLVFSTNNLCFTPGGIASSQDNSTMSLLRRFDYASSNKYRTHYLIGNPLTQRGTYATFDCDGIQDIHLGGYVEFNRDYILPANSSGGLFSTGMMAAVFQTSFQSNYDWVAELSFENTINQAGLRFTNYFQLIGFDDYVFNIEDVLLDNSLIVNPTDMSFPEGLTNTPTWKGVYIRNAEMQFPPFVKQNGQRKSISVENLIWDNQGFTADINATNVMIPNQGGDIGGWDFTIEEFNLRILKSNPIETNFNGEMTLPIATKSMPYNVGIEKSNSGTTYDFDVGYVDNITIPMWGAKINIDNTSTIGIEIVNNEVDFTTNINGHLSLDNSIGDFTSINLKNIAFNNLQLTNAPPYLSGINFDLNPNMNARFLGFDIGINDIEVLQPNNINSQQDFVLPLQFDLDFTFGEGVNSLGGASLFRLNAKKLRNSQNWEFDGVEIDRIDIDAEISSVSIDGHVQFFKDNSIFGTGFKGSMSADVMGEFSMNADVLFGHKQSYDYWYVGGNAKFPATIPLSPAIGLNGMGGGAYYNMRQNNTMSVSQIGTNSKPTYLPQEGGWGLKATVCFATIPSESLATGNMTLEASFTPSGALNIVSLEGQAWLMKEPSIAQGVSNGNGSDSAVELAGILTYDHTNKVVDGSLGYKLAIPPSYPLINTDRLTHKVIRFHFANANDWYVHLGKPNSQGTFDDMIAVTVDKQMRFLGKRINLHYGLYTYFDIGTNMPPFPPLPAKVRRILGNSNSYAQPAQLGAGVAGGFHANFAISRTRFRYRALYTNWTAYFDASAGYGFDLALNRTDGFLCNGNPSFGVNNYFARGQGYLYGDAHLKANGIKVGVEFAAAVQVELPNPTFIKGQIAARVDIGLFDLRIRKGFAIGTKCQLSEDPDANSDLVMSNIQNLEIIRSFSYPEVDDEVDFSDPAFSAVVDLHIPPGEVYNSSYGSVTMYYKTEVSYKLKERRNNSYVTVATMSQMRNTLIEDNMVIHINDYSNRNLQPNKWYKFELTASLYYKQSSNGPWLVVKTDSNQNVEEKKFFFFRTESAATKLDDDDIVRATPRLYTNYFHQDDQSNETYICSRNTGVMSHFGNNPIVKMKFYKNYYETPTTVNVSYNENTGFGYFNFILPNFESSTGYRVRIEVADRNDPTHPKVIYTYYFKTSKYRTLKEKLESLNLTSDGVVSSGNVKYLSLNCGESFEENELVFEPDYLLFFPNNEWSIYRNRLMNFVRDHNIDHMITYNELRLDPSFQNFTPPLDLSSAGTSGNISTLANNLGYANVNDFTLDFGITNFSNVANQQVSQNQMNINQLGQFGMALGTHLKLKWSPQSYLNLVRYKCRLYLMQQGVYSGADWDFLIHSIPDFPESQIHTIKFYGNVEMDWDEEAFINININ